MNDPDSLWIWKSANKYWNSEKERWVKDKDKATVYPWWRATLIVTVGTGEWIKADTQ